VLEHAMINKNRYICFQKGQQCKSPRGLDLWGGDASHIMCEPLSSHLYKLCWTISNECWK